MKTNHRFGKSPAAVVLEHKLNNARQPGEVISRNLNKLNIILKDINNSTMNADIKSSVISIVKNHFINHIENTNNIQKDVKTFTKNLITTACKKIK